LLDVFDDARRRWHLGKPLVHIIDREADSVDHYRRWSHRGHQFVVRADTDRIVKLNDQDVKLSHLASQGHLPWQPVKDAAGRPQTVDITGVVGTLWVAEVCVVLDRPAKKRVVKKNQKKQITVPGVALPLRLVVSWVLAEDGTILAEWYLFSNVGDQFAAAIVACW
jgi:hypothetical protein